MGGRKSPGKTSLLNSCPQGHMDSQQSLQGGPGTGLCGVTWAPLWDDAVSVWHEPEAQLLDLNSM